MSQEMQLASPEIPTMGTTSVNDPPPLVTPEPEDVLDPVVPETLTKALRKSRSAEKVPETAPPADALPERFGEHEALLRAFAQHVLNHVDAALNDSTREANTAVNDLYSYVKSLIQTDQERLRHAETLLDTLTTKALTEGLTLRSTPTQQLTIQTVSPQGFPVSFQLAKASIGELIAELPLATDWLSQHGYKPVG
jgi:hypothetical protein